MERFLAQANDVIRWCRTLAELTEEPGHTTRTFLSAPMHDVHARLRAWMERVGMSVTIDAAGNLRGFYPGRGQRRLLIGSHLDTVPHAGAFDGVLGVVLGIALVEELAGRQLDFGIEVIGFSEEEGVRFGVPFIGSRAIAGTLDDALQQRIAGPTRNFGLDPARLSEAVLSGDVIGFFEIHIEQGPVLDDEGLPLGVVEAIADKSRIEVRFEGRANHAGTTPMELRKDALAGAAEWILAVERDARANDGLHATVGQIAAEPGARNVIPGVVRLTLDLRDADDDVRQRAAERLDRCAAQIAARRGLTVSFERQVEQPAVAMSAPLTNLLERAVDEAGYPGRRMVSGAGHDAMILAARVPTAMLFVRSPGGVSHHPDETVLPEDVAAALSTGIAFLDRLEAADG